MGARINLNAAIRECFELVCAETSTFRPQRIRELIKERYPEVVAEHREAADNYFLLDRINRVTKGIRPRDASQTTLLLPHEIEHLDLHGVFFIPPEGREGDEKIDESECKCVAFGQATFRQVEQNVDFLTTCIRRDQRRLRQVQQLYNYLRPHLASTPDEPIAPVLKRIREGQDEMMAALGEEDEEEAA